MPRRVQVSRRALVLPAHVSLQSLQQHLRVLRHYCRTRDSIIWKARPSRHPGNPLLMPPTWIHSLIINLRHLHQTLCLNRRPCKNEFSLSFPTLFKCVLVVNQNKCNKMRFSHVNNSCLPYSSANFDEHQGSSECPAPFSILLLIAFIDKYCCR